MSAGDYLILMGVGGFFLVLGIVLITWGRGEEKGYYDATATHLDMREYLERDSSEHPGLGAPKVGGWIAIAIGLVMVVMGAGFWLWG